jgi:hypothetical protein
VEKVNAKNIDLTPAMDKFEFCQMSRADPIYLVSLI